MHRALVVTILVAATAFGAARVASTQLLTPARASTPPVEAERVVQGLRIPDAVLQSANGQPVTIRRLAAEAGGPLVVMVMSPGCQSCNTDLPVWQEVVARRTGQARFVLLVCATDFKEMQPVVEKARGTTPLYLCDTIMRKAWGLRRLPAVIVLDHAAAVQFVDMGGPGASLIDTYFSTLTGASSSG